MLTNSASTVAESLRTIQQGINDARGEKEVLNTNLEEIIDALKFKVEDGSRVSIDKIQKGKDDAWALIYEGEEPYPVEEPLPDECIIWESANYRGNSKHIVNNPDLQ